MESQIFSMYLITQNGNRRQPSKYGLYNFFPFRWHRGILMLNWKLQDSIFKTSIPVKGGELFLQITCGHDWFLVQKLNSFSSFFKRQLGSQCQEGVELRRTLSVAFKWDISWRASFQGGLSVGGVKILGCYWNLDWRWREGTRRGMLGGVKSLLLQGKGTRHLLLYNSHLEPMILSPHGIFGSSLLSFPSVSKLHPLKAVLASGAWVHPGNEMKQDKLGSNRSRLILLHNGDEQYLHNNILGC